MPANARARRGRLRMTDDVNSGDVTGDGSVPAAPENSHNGNNRPQQQEMPLAMVLGQPVLQIPQDLYIPPDALEVIQSMHEMRFELAAEYLVMAAMLAEIKSRMLLPRAPTEEGLEDDPRAELVRRLQEYERFKKAAEDIDALPRQDRDTTPATAFVPDRASVKLPPPVEMKEMLLALHDVLKRAELFTQHAIKRDALSVRQRMADLLEALKDGAFHRFESLFTAEEGKLGVVVTFLGLLTLAKEQLLEIVQEGPLQPIYVKSLALMKEGEEIELSSEFDTPAANDDSR